MVPENPFHPEFRPNPYPLYHYMRSMAPVHRSMFGWLLTRHADCREVLGHEVRFSHDFDNHAYYRRWREDGWEPGPIHAFLSRTLTYQDAAEHTSTRELLTAAFVRSPFASLQADIEEHVGRLLEPAIGSGGMDFIKDFAYPLPIAVVGDWLGIPRDDVEAVREWTAQLTPVLDPLEVRQAEGQGMAAELSLLEYLSHLIDDRRTRTKHDLLSALLEVEVGGKQMSTWDVATSCMFLLMAAHDFTVNLLGNGMLALLRNPDQLELLTQKPELASAAVEEVLRYDSPLQLTSRATMEAVELGGVSIPKGEDVLLILGAANRDPARFREPDRFDICRDASGHLAFTDGPHACLGAPLARSIGATALREMTGRLPRLTLATDEPSWRDTVARRGLTSLPVAF
jgi:cytochrome P450